MNEISRQLLVAYQGPLLDEPVKLDILAFRTRPKALTSGVFYAAVKPDCDNICKLIGDCLQGTVLVNDSRIAVVTVEKYFAERGETPRVEITLSTLRKPSQEWRIEPVDDRIFKLLDFKESMSLHELSVKLGMKPKDMLNTIRTFKIPYETIKAAS